MNQEIKVGMVLDMKVGDFLAGLRQARGGFQATARNIQTEAGRIQTALRRIDAFRRLKKETLEAEKSWREATAEVARLVREIRATEKPTRQMTNAFDRAKRQAARLKDAFQQKRDALHHTRKELAAADIDTGKLVEAERRLRQQLASTTHAIKAWNTVQQQLAVSTIRSAGGVGLLRGQLLGMAAVLGSGLGFSSMMRSGLEMERIMTRLTYVFGSTIAARKEMAWITATAQRLGLELTAAADGYARLSAATKGTVLAGKTTRRLFLSMSQAAAVLKLDAFALQRAFTAIEQMASKGKISAEELRQQLGDHLPGAFKLAARAAGVTTAEFDKMLASGQVMAEDFLPKFAQVLEDEFAGSAEKASRSAQASLHRLTNAWTLANAEFSQSGFLQGIADGAEALASELRDPAIAASLKVTGQLLGQIITLAGENLNLILSLTAGYAGLKGSLAILTALRAGWAVLLPVMTMVGTLGAGFAAGLTMWGVAAAWGSKKITEFVPLLLEAEGAEHGVEERARSAAREMAEFAKANGSAAATLEGLIAGSRTWGALQDHEIIRLRELIRLRLEALSAERQRLELEQARPIQGWWTDHTEQIRSLADEERKYLTVVRDLGQHLKNRQTASGGADGGESAWHQAAAANHQRMMRLEEERVAKRQGSATWLTLLEKRLADEQDKAVKQALQEKIQALKEEQQAAERLSALEKQSEDAKRAEARKTLSEKIRTADQAVQKTQQAVQKSLDAEIQLANKIADLEEKKRNARLSTEERIRELRERGMTDAQKQASREAAAFEKMQQAAEHLNKKSPTEKDFAWAEKLTRQAQEMYAGLTDTSKAINGVEQSGKLLNILYEQQEKVAKKALDEQKKNTRALKDDLLIAEDAAARLKEDLEAIPDKVEKSVELKAQVEDAARNLARIRDALGMIRDKTVTITTRQVQARAAGGLLGAMMTGLAGRISGPGGPTDDAILARVSDGEYVVNARKTGMALPLLEFLNWAPFERVDAFLKALPQFNAGGLVDRIRPHIPDSVYRFAESGGRMPSTREPTVTEVHQVNISLNGQHAATAVMPPEPAMALRDALRKLANGLI